MFNEILMEQMDATDAVKEAIDNAYFKQQEFLESYDGEEDLSSFNIFQEGFLFPSKPRELDIFRFDNKHIIKAIRHFDKAYDELPSLTEHKKDYETGHDLFIKRSYYTQVKNIFESTDSQFSKGLHELEQQFDCVITVQYDEERYTFGTGSLVQFIDKPRTLTVSKTKGFQLDGANIVLVMSVQCLLDLAPKREVFGQFVVSTLLHEIFHNIAKMTNVRKKKVSDYIKPALSDTSNTKNPVAVKSRMNRLIDDIKKFLNLSNSDIETKQTLNRLYILSNIQNNPKALNEFKKDMDLNIDKTKDEIDLDSYIERLKKINKKAKNKRVINNILKSSKIAIAFMIFLNSLYLKKHSYTIIDQNAFQKVSVKPMNVISNVALTGILVLSMGKLALENLNHEGKLEEYYADLFAGMYQLPVHLNTYYRLLKLNKKYPDKVKKAVQLDTNWHKSYKDVHPADFDREKTSYIIAKQILDSKRHIKPEIKKYLKYIVDLHEGIIDINVDTKYSLKSIDPEKAKDIQQFMKDFVAQTGIPVTEFAEYIDDFDGDECYD